MNEFLSQALQGKTLFGYLIPFRAGDSCLKDIQILSMFVCTNTSNAAFQAWTD